MGLFRAIGRFMGGAIETIGDIIGSDTISNFGFNIKTSCEDEIGSSQSYEKEQGSFSETNRMNEILVSFSTDYHKRATKLEDRCINMVTKFYDSLIDKIESMPDSARNKSNLKALKRGREKIRQNITGEITNHISKRVSLDDRECLAILKMDAGSDKTKAMTIFCKKVLSEALDNLAKKVRKTINEQIGDVEDYLQDVVEENQNKFLSLKIQLEEISKNYNKETQEKEKSYIQPLVIIDTVDIVGQILK